MISQFEVSALLRTEIPQLADKICPSKVSLEVYAFMNYFSDYTKHNIEAHNFNAARKCFALADKLFRHGDAIVRMLIENVFVFGFSAFLPTPGLERSMVLSMIPDKLYRLYLKQVMQSAS